MPCTCAKEVIYPFADKEWRRNGDCADIMVRVTANARKASVEMVNAGSYRARVDAPAVEGKANARLIEMLAEHFGVPKSGVIILSGAKSKSKKVRIVQ